MIDQLRFDDYLEIDSVCDAYESGWTPDSALTLKSVLEQCPVPLRRFAFLELLKVDVELRQLKGVPAARIDYLKLYPEYREAIDAVIETAATEPQATLVSSSLASAEEGLTETENAGATESHFGRFILKSELGRGAFGTVFLAYDPTLDREVALKLPRFDQQDRERIDRFLAEAQIAAQLQHPHIVAVWERGQVGDQYYISAAYVQGETLKEYLDRTRPAIRQAVTWIRDLAEALAYAHEQNIIHRDMKPANVIINARQRPMIMDFGLAKRIDQELDLTSDGLIMGTPAYMSPEQARGQTQELGKQSDQYSLGGIFYELLTGKPRWSGKTHAVLLQLQTDPPPPEIAGPETPIPVDLIAVCQKMLEPAREDRYPDCQAIADDLTRWLDGHPVSVRRVSQFERFSRWCQRNRVISSLILSSALILVVSLTVVSFSLFAASEARDEARQNLAYAEIQEKEAVSERDNALAAAEEQRKESARNSLLLAGYNIRAGRFYEAEELLKAVDPQDRGWIWKLQSARIPRILCTIPHPDGQEFKNANVYFDDTGEKLALAHLDGDRVVTWLCDARTGKFLQRVGDDYHFVAPGGIGFTKGGRYLLVNLRNRMPNGLPSEGKLGVYDVEQNKIIATREKIRNFSPSRLASEQVVLQKINEKGQSQYLSWNFITGNEVDHGTGVYCLPFNFSVNPEGTELALRHKNLVSINAADQEQTVSRTIMVRLGATHWNVSQDQKYVVGQLRDPWPWNRRNKMVPAGQAAVVQFPARMISVLETDDSVAHALFQYAELQSMTLNTFNQASGFALSTNDRYVVLNSGNTESSIPQKKEICWWHRETGEYLGKAMGTAVSPTGEQFATIEAKAVRIREAPLRIRRFHSETVETELAKWEPVQPHKRNRVYPNILYDQEEPWVVMIHDQGQETVDLETRVVSLKHASDIFYEQARRVAFHEPTGMLALINGNDFLDLFSLRTGEQVAHLRCDPWPVNTDLDFHPDGNLLAVGHADALVIWSIPEQKIIHRNHDLKFMEEGNGKLRFTPDGKYLFIYGKRIDTRTWQPTAEQPFETNRPIKFSPDSRLLSIDTREGLVQIHEVETGQMVHQIGTDAQAVYSQFHPREPLLAVARSDGQLEIFDTRTWDLVLDEPLPRGELVDLVFSAAGDSLAVGVQAKGTRRWFEFSSRQSE